MPRSSNLRTSSSLANPDRRTNDVIEVASIGPEETLPQIAVVRCRCALCPRGGRTMQYRTWLNHRINLEFSEADNQPLSSSSGADDVAAPTLPSVPLSDDSVPGDISIPRPSPLLASPRLFPMMLFPQVRGLHKAVMKGRLWILMMGKAIMAFLLSWWMSLSLKQALRVMEMQMSSTIALVISSANGLPKFLNL
ncbi:hypothetical protein C362_02254 [Cryptococcus neoformans Bt1]|nr:hypothetical protein C362_02254 [Cryptococcus neoformans var. grubii Bt1]